jgi:hypothetical protein
MGLDVYLDGRLIGSCSEYAVEYMIEGLLRDGVDIDLDRTVVRPLGVSLWTYPTVFN